jgi:2,4-dienoyl-CoA reductase-like NADH-dependent reductase (Old Yellow Enzyme family)
MLTGGWDIEDTVRLVKILKDLQVDVIDCSSGKFVHEIFSNVKRWK